MWLRPAPAPRDLERSLNVRRNWTTQCTLVFNDKWHRIQLDRVPQPGETITMLCGITALAEFERLKEPRTHVIPTQCWKCEPIYRRLCASASRQATPSSGPARYPHPRWPFGRARMAHTDGDDVNAAWFPDIDVASLRRQLERRHATCARDADGTVRCTAGNDSDGAEVLIIVSTQHPTKITEVRFIAWSAGPAGTTSDYRARAVANLGQVLDNVLPLLLPNTPNVPDRIASWIEHALRHPAQDAALLPTLVDRYWIRCFDGSPISISGPKGAITAYTITATMQAT